MPYCVYFFMLNMAYKDGTKDISNTRTSSKHARLDCMALKAEQTNCLTP